MLEKLRVDNQKIAKKAKHLPFLHSEVVTKYYGFDDNGKESLEKIAEELKDTPYYHLTPEILREILIEAEFMLDVNLNRFKPDSTPVTEVNPFSSKKDAAGYDFCDKANPKGKSIFKTHYYHNMQTGKSKREIDYCKLELIALDSDGFENLKKIETSKERRGCEFFVELDYVLQNRKGLLVGAACTWGDIYRLRDGCKDIRALEEGLKERFGFADYVIAPELENLYDFAEHVYGDEFHPLKAQDYPGMRACARMILGTIEDIDKIVIAQIDTSNPKAEDIFRYFYLDLKDAERICFEYPYFLADQVDNDCN